MTDTAREIYHVAVGDTAPFGALHVVHVTASNDIDAAYQAGIALITKSGIGLEAAGWTVRGVQSESDRQAELAHEAEQERRQQLHDEMTDDALAQDGRWG